MYVSEEFYGKVRMNSHIASPMAAEFLSYYRTAGWHACNAQYYQRYAKGGSGVFLLFTVKGEGRIHIGETEYSLKQNFMALVPPGVPMKYYTKPGADWEFYWITLMGNAAAQTAGYLLAQGPPVRAFAGFSDFPRQVEGILQLEKINQTYFELELSKRISDLLLEVAKLYLFDGPSGSEQLAVRIAGHLEAHFQEPLSISALSEQFHLSKNQLIRIFSALFGYTPYEYLLNYRLLKACEYLEKSAVPVGDAAALCGFRSASNFIAQFKRRYRLTPGLYRKERSGRI